MGIQSGITNQLLRIMVAYVHGGNARGMSWDFSDILWVFRKLSTDTPSIPRRAGDAGLAEG
jgi:hypothetical protein